MRLELSVLAPPQRRFWDTAARRLPRTFVLYGGTAVALRLGHRSSVDFDFFSDVDLPTGEIDAVLDDVPAQTLQRGPQTLVLALSLEGQQVRLALYGRIGIGRVGEPARAENGIAIASPLDLLATKLKALHDRIEAKDYLDVEALLRSGLDLTAGVMAARALFGDRLNPLDTAKAVAWFEDGGLEASLPRRTRSFLERSAQRFDPGGPVPPRLSQRLAAEG